jgi:peptidoglycan/LPS O-acetylase OafA/YrhL
MVELRALTSLRGLAAFYVVLLHYSTAFEHHAVATIPSLAPRGYLAVDLFFVLSGFIMTYSYAADFRQYGFVRAAPSFMIKRVARLIPLHWFITFALLTYTLAVSPGFTGSVKPAFESANPVRDVIFNLLLLQGLGLAPNMNGPSWSISVEFFAYLAFPLFLKLVFHTSSWIRGLLAVGAVLALAATAMHGHRLSLETQTVSWTLVRCFSEFVLGMVVYHSYSMDPRAKRFGTSRVLSIMLLIAATMVLLRLWDLVAVLTFPFIILGVAYNSSWVTKVLDHRFMYFMGVISFSLYMIHYPIAYLELSLVKQLHSQALGQTAALAVAFAGSLTTIPIAWCTYRWIEYPGRDFIRSLARRFAVARG